MKDVAARTIQLLQEPPYYPMYHLASAEGVPSAEENTEAISGPEITIEVAGRHMYADGDGLTTGFNRGGNVAHHISDPSRYACVHMGKNAPTDIANRTCVRCDLQGKQYS